MQVASNPLSGALEIVVRSDPGMMRRYNEDAVFANPALGLVILADGMGGYNAGEVASSMAITGISAALEQDFFLHSPYAIGGAPVSFPDNGVMSDPTKLMILGAWNNLVYAIRKDITWKFLDQATISDADGKVIYNFAQNDMVGMRVVMRLGFAMPNPVSRIKPRAQRYPFAVLKTA